MGQRARCRIGPVGPAPVTVIQLETDKRRRMREGTKRQRPWLRVIRGVLPTLVWLSMAGQVTAITDNGHTAQVVGVSGRRVDLPCDLRTSDPEDSPSLVLWYKDEASGSGLDRVPVFSFDFRKELSDSDQAVGSGLALSERAIFLTRMDVPSLRLGSTVPMDQGLYRCRVDFGRSPTRNHRVNLTITIPPDRPIILFNNRPVTGRIGPLNEDDPLELTCLSQGGRPRPRVVWFRDEHLLDSSDESLRQGQVTNTLRLPPLGRDDLRLRLVCSSSNSNISLPSVNDVTIEMNFRPLSVEILGSSHTSMSVGRTYDIVCRTFGSRPSANVTWWIRGERIAGDITTSSQANSTTSTLSFRPRAGDNDQHLICRAENERMSSASLEDRRNLNVRFAPSVELRLGVALDADDIKEGANVYFDCTVTANPPVYSVVWTHDGLTVEPTSRTTGGDRVTVQDRSLIVRNVTRHSAGAYVCKASNPEGDGASRPLQLNVKYAPVCVSGQKTRYGTALFEEVRVTCRVDANPPEVTFKWQLSNSIKKADIPYSQTFTRGLESRATHTPTTSLDYGVLLCQADNAIGRMMQPCVFHVTAAGRPDPVHNCTLINQTSESLEVECAAGFDGGLSQYFVAELFDLTNDRLVRNLTRPFPEFSVTQLPAGLELRLQLYAANGRGRSHPVTLEGFTLKLPAKRTSKGIAEPPPASSNAATPILGVLIGLVATLIIIALAAVACIRNSSSQRKSAKTSLASPRSNLDKPEEEAPKDFLELEPNLKLSEPEDPDVIPCHGDLDKEATEGTLMLNHLTGNPHRNNSSQRQLRVRPNHNLHQEDDVTYAELTLSRSDGPGKVIRGREQEGDIIYASIDHGKVGSLPKDTVVRAPLLTNDQESVV